METQAGPLKKVFISTQSQAVDDLEYFTVNFNDSKRKLVFQKYRDQFFEMKKVNTGTSAFAGEHIISDGSIYLLTQLDMAYLFLSFLDQLKRKNERLKSILLKDLPSYFDNSEEKEIIQRLIKSEKASQKLNKICNISIIDLGEGSLMAISLNNEKVFAFIEEKVSKAKSVVMKEYFEMLTEEAKEKPAIMLALSISSEYFPPAVFEEYLMVKHKLTLQKVIDYRITGETDRRKRDEFEEDKRPQSTKKPKTNDYSAAKAQKMAKGNQSITSFMKSKF
eukprot:TRINITY_DN3313_c0_g1_i5.p1 TRINITY_DN3313_c0_g1~~TRINITY_DN3313_c0_g1_i5.p1  ORF type:complete len:278 (-),score=57.33 TRINITY_DN3313_c0_g1_i5:46-879(-)